jgi:hypothetical protein
VRHQLAHVTDPGALHQECGDERRIERERGTVPALDEGGRVELGVLVSDALDGVIDEERNVATALVETGDLETEREAVEEIVLERARATVGGCDDAQLGAAHRRLAESLIFSIAIEHAQEVRLGVFG